jgi:hypothetical protein
MYRIELATLEIWTAKHPGLRLDRALARASIETPSFVAKADGESGTPFQEQAKLSGQ